MKKIQFPITVSKIKECYFAFPFGRHFNNTKRPFVAVRPCNEKYKGETYVGILIGDATLGLQHILNKEGELEVLPHVNPCILIPELREVVFGCGSWWRLLESIEDFADITDKTIENTWYVKALKSLEEA